MLLDDMVDELRSFPGIKRKNDIQRVVDSLPVDGFPRVFASRGEDAAALDAGDRFILFAADGIMESLVRSEPYYAGYFSVLVNVNDIAAMGGRALGMVDVLSSTGEGLSSEILRGIREGIRKFNVPVVGGHTHPDSNYDAIDISIVGEVRKDAILLSSTARPGDDIVFAIDLEGFYPEKLPYAYVTTVDRSDEMVRDQMEAVAVIGERHLAHACKDMSNPGHVGTLGMMLESSRVGGTVDIRKIPIPDGVDPILWAKSYQGCGFCLSVDPSDSEEVISIFEKVGCTGAVVGKVENGHELRLTDGNGVRVLFDFTSDKITGL
ncbi:MAG: methanogenesis marker 2 protein [Candidatus Methanomethylophilaceae archaeon]|nr:methanogenesis marker 2 protein [Candidatus Methanomethylophilaceae archaeon]